MTPPHLEGINAAVLPAPDPMSSHHLRVQVENELPGELKVGRGTALFVCGWCFSPQHRIAGLSFVLGSERQPVMAHGMPRLDPLRALSEPNAYRSGFWGIVCVGPQPSPGEVGLSLHAELEHGGEAVCELATIPIVPADEPVEVT